jgi:hypothetical protein
MGSKWIRLDKVRAMVELLTSKAREAAEKRTGKVIADLSECLEVLTTVRRAKAADYLTAGELDPTGPHGEVVRRRRPPGPGGPAGAESP